eukprot:901493_1
MDYLEPFTEPTSDSHRYRIFLCYFIISSCFTGQHSNCVEIHHVDHPNHNIYRESIIMQYLIDEYIPSLRQKAVTFRYDEGNSRKQILRKYVGIQDVVALICDFCELKHSGFLYL